MDTPPLAELVIAWKACDGMVKLKVGQLSFDKSVYPRCDVDPHHVEHIAQAMEAGVKFPPIIICKATRRVADGFHRGRAVEKLLGDAGEIACIEKTYANDEEFFLDSVRYNSEHGLSLSPADRGKIVEMAAVLRIDVGRVALALRTTARAVGKLSARPATQGLSVRPAIPHPVITEKPSGRGSVPAVVTALALSLPSPNSVDAIFQEVEARREEPVPLPMAPERGVQADSPDSTSIRLALQAIKYSDWLVQYIAGDNFDHDCEELIFSLGKLDDALCWNAKPV
jgi:hypothetical protein